MTMTLPRIGLGCMALSGLYGPLSKAEALDVIHCALDQGVSHFDTAELYGPHTNGSLLAEALDGRSHGWTIETKVGYAIRDGAVVGIDNTAATLLVDRGKVAEIGLSAVDGATLARAHAVHPVAAVQNEYSLIARSAEEDTLPRARKFHSSRSRR
jgi:aryl-alcohol dehydrogenase-like predicted oxidoreductase